MDRLLKRYLASNGAGRVDASRCLPGRHACGHDGQADAYLYHISTGATAETGRSAQGDSGRMNFNRNTP